MECDSTLVIAVLVLNLNLVDPRVVLDGREDGESRVVWGCLDLELASLHDGHEVLAVGEALPGPGDFGGGRAGDAHRQVDVLALADGDGGRVLLHTGGGCGMERRR